PQIPTSDDLLPPRIPYQSLLRLLRSSFPRLVQVTRHDLLCCGHLLRQDIGFVRGDQNSGVGKKGCTEAMFVGEKLKGAVRVVEGGSRRRSVSKVTWILIHP